MKPQIRICYGEVIVKAHVLRETIEAADAEAVMDCPQRSVDYWHKFIASAPDFDADKESLVVLVLDSKMHIKGHSLVSLGGLNQTVCHAREVYRMAIVLAGAHIVLMHNHPSGDATPSNEDLKATIDLAAAGKILGIPLIDHVIVGRSSDKIGRGFISLREAGSF